MAYKTLIFGIDDLYPKLKPFYDSMVKRGIFQIAATADIKTDAINLIYADGKQVGTDEIADFDLVIISSKNAFHQRMRQLKTLGVSRNQIIDGRVFKVPGLNFPRLLKEGVAYGIIEKTSLVAKSYTNYPQIYKTKNGKITLSLGTKSYIRGCSFDPTSLGLVSIKKFSSLATNIFFSVGLNATHNYRNVSMFSRSSADWKVPEEFLPPQGTCKILIGNDVWSGRGCIFKCTNPNKPLVIGDGAVIAADSVVVKDVPPYAIVGGNPAQIIKYRFEPHVIEAMMRIKWWDWDIDKIYDNFKYFNDVEKFISLHDA